MDTSSDPSITFDHDGICNHCHEYWRRMREEVPAGDARVYLDGLVERIKKSGAGHQYDCVIGVSGGVDSTYVAWLCKKEFGLRPLAIHFDNGWNSELAVQNIETVLRKLNIDLYTHVVDWEEFRDIQVAFLKSGIVNWELPTDHAIRALLYREAARRGIRYIITGSNLATEAVTPAAWKVSNIDFRLLKAIHRRFGKRKLRTFPTLSLKMLAWYTFVHRITQIPILNYVDYKVERAKALLEQGLGWRPYEFKHGESLFTRFFQRYFLPHKFGYDKRKPHLSNLILSGQMTRDEGFEELNKPLYYPEELERDFAYVAKKLELTTKELKAHLDSPPRSHGVYPNSDWVQDRLPHLIAIAKRTATGREF
jgi:N-acetyl sugar amidotransferase